MDAVATIGDLGEDSNKKIHILTIMKTNTPISPSVDGNMPRTGDKTLRYGKGASTSSPSITTKRNNHLLLAGLIILAVIYTVVTGSTAADAVENATTWEAISNITGFSEIRDIEVNSAGDSIILLTGLTIYEIQLENAYVLRKSRLGFSSAGPMDWSDDQGWLALKVDDALPGDAGESPLAVIDLSGEIVALFSPWGSLPTYKSSDVVDLEWRPFSPQLAVFFKDGTLRIYDIDEQSLVGETKLTTSASRIEWSPSGGLLAIQTRQVSSGGDGIAIYDVEQNKSWTAIPPAADIHDIGWSRDSQYLFYTITVGVRRVEIASNDSETVVETDAEGIAPSPAEDLIVLIEDYKGITFWDYGADTHELHESAHYLSLEADWTTDGSYFYVMEEETLVIRVWARATIPPPTVGIDFPAPEMVVSGVVEVSGWASSHYGNHLTVSVKIGSGDWMPAEGHTEWRLDFNTTTVPDGWVNVRARAVDPAGTSVIAIVRVQVQNQNQPGNKPPRVWFDEPGDGANVWTVARFLGGASDDKGVVSVQLRVDLGSWEKAELDSTGSFVSWLYAFNFMSITGELVIEARAYDGHLFSEVAALTVNVVWPPTETYSVEILYPAKEANVSNAFSVSGIVKGGTPEVVCVRLDYGPLRIASGALSWSIDYSDVPMGMHRVYAVAAGDSGLSPWIAVKFFVTQDATNQPPAAGIDVPGAGVVVQGDLRARGWSADDREVESVSVRVNGGEWVEADGTTEWSLLVRDNDLDEGWNDIEVRAFDGELYSKTNTTRFYFVPGGLHVRGESQVLLWVSVLLAIVATVAVVYALRVRGSGDGSGRRERGGEFRQVEARR